MYFKVPVFNTAKVDVKPNQRYALDWILPSIFSNVDTSRLMNVDLLGYAVVENISIRGNKLEVIIRITEHASPLIPIIVVCTTLVAAMFFFHIDAPKVSRVLSASTVLIVSGVVAVGFLTGFGKRSVRT